MRREDKKRVSPRLKVRLPSGYYLDAVLGGYRLFFSHSEGIYGRMTAMVAAFTPDSTAQEIEAAARAHSNEEA